MRLLDRPGENLIRNIGDGLPVLDRDDLPDDSGELQQALRGCAEPGNAVIDELPHERWHRCLREITQSPPMGGERHDLLMLQGAEEFLQEKGIPLGSLDQEVLERHKATVVPQQRLQEGLDALRGQGIEPKLGVVGLAPQPC